MASTPPLPVPPPAPARLWSLDALRGVCALVVFLSHWHLWSHFPPEGAFAAGLHAVLTLLHDAVTLLTWPTGGNHPALIAFFVLSGFCIHYPFERRTLAGEVPSGWRSYFRRRFFRIMPVYWAGCALGALFVAAEALRPSGDPLLQLHATASAEDFLVRVAGIGAAYPKEIFAGNYILFTVATEIGMYALYPAFHHFARRGHWAALGGVFLIAQLAAVVVLLPRANPFWVFNSVFMVGIFWYLGALAAHLFLARRLRVSAFSLLLIWAVFLALKALPPFYGLNLLKQAVWGLVCMLGILYAVQREREGRMTTAHTRLGTKLQWCGDFSYSLYALHTPAIMLGTWALHQLGHGAYLTQLVITFAGSVLVTLGVHYGIERRFYAPRAVSGS